MLIAEVLLGAVVDGVDEDSTVHGATTQECDAAFDGASLVILVRYSLQRFCWSTEKGLTGHR